MSGNKAWFETGYGGADREQEKRDTGAFAPKRWWLGEGKTKEVVFIDDSPFCFDEHQWKKDGDFNYSFAACLAKISQEPCPGCTTKGVQKAEYVGHLTAVDITGYVTKDGKEVKYELIEFCPKLKAMNKLKLKKQQKGSLIGQLYSVSRTDKNAPNTGDDFDHVREVNMDSLFKMVTYRGKNLSELIAKANLPGEDAARQRKFLSHTFSIPESGPIPLAIPAFNYVSLHTPLDTAEFRKAALGAIGFGQTGGGFSKPAGSGTTADDTVPF